MIPTITKIQQNPVHYHIIYSTHIFVFRKYLGARCKQVQFFSGSSFSSNSSSFSSQKGGKYKSVETEV